MSITKSALILFALVLVAACSRGGLTAAPFERPEWMSKEDAPQPTTSFMPDVGQGAAPERPRPIPSPPFEIPPIPVPGRPVQSDADVREVYDDLVAAGYAIGAEPDPARVKDVWAEVCPCYEYFERHAEAMLVAGEYAISPLPEIVEFDVINRTASMFHVNAVRRSLGGTTYDDAGGVVRESAVGAPEKLHVVAAIVEGAWKFVAVGQGHL
jgi:hypothetical protein